MESKKKIHVVAFNVPYPPNYGGIIDIYYKIKALKEGGIGVILHAFVYERGEARELEEVADKVYYYKRNTGIRYLFHSIPYIVISRKSALLEKNLLSDGYPVFFEGLHTSFLLEKCIEAGKTSFVRAHNIEHNYYSMLAKSEKNIFRKLFFISESRKLKKYEGKLALASKLFPISITDTAYFNDTYGKSVYLSAFHQQNMVSATEGQGEYILFHGNLSVPENENALIYLVNNVLSRIKHRVIIAGKDPGKGVRKICSRHSNIELIENPVGVHMDELVAKAQINLLYTYQPTGLKLKLLHSLYAGRFCMANPLMLSGSGLDELCIIYKTPGEAISKIDELMELSFSNSIIEERIAKLKDYDNAINAQKIIAEL